ncbi:MAG TPA: L-arabinose isomerase [Propionibacteriaceae bacterium]|nr:L-arabinose isomerase [Propionibacteriaceae bacterium]
MQGNTVVPVLSDLEVWFLVGSQGLYGEETLRQVAEQSRQVVGMLAQHSDIPVRLVLKPTLTDSDAIVATLGVANADPAVIGVITWMHTFSPAKMWIRGLSALRKPLLHFHTQANRDLPYGELDFDFMNLNQSAHGDREYGYILSRLGVRRKSVVGHASDPRVAREIGSWCRAAAAWHAAQGMRVARFGDNMRYVAVTEGDKTEAEAVFGVSVNTWPVNELAELVDQVGDAAVDDLVAEYDDSYDVVPELRAGGDRRDALRYAAREEIALREFLVSGGFTAFTDTFEDLGALRQLPGLAVQRLMADGYGFGAEGDWKTAALVRAVKVMAAGLKGGTSFMEDYTYHFDSMGSKVLGAHMLEVCPSIAQHTPALEVHPLSIGGKDDPVRLVFDVPNGPAVNATVLDMGNRLRMLVNQVEVVPPDAPLPKLPVARAVWVPRPSLEVAAACWILAGGAHHTAFSQAVTAEHLEDFAEIAGMEFALIADKTEISDFKKELRWNEVYYSLARGL